MQTSQNELELQHGATASNQFFKSLRTNQIEGAKPHELEVTRFKSLRSTKPQETCRLTDVLDEIKSDKYESKINEVRIHENPSKSPIKDRLPVFTPTGIFNHRSKKGLESYNGLICLDIDNVRQPETLKYRCTQLPYVTAAFITPSGQGLKVFIQTNATTETYKDVEIKVAELFETESGFARDKHCKDIARIQYVSHDPKLYINPNPSKLIINL